MRHRAAFPVPVTMAALPSPPCAVAQPGSSRKISPGNIARCYRQDSPRIRIMGYHRRLATTTHLGAYPDTSIASPTSSVGMLGLASVSRVYIEYMNLYKQTINQHLWQKQCRFRTDHSPLRKSHPTNLLRGNPFFLFVGRLAPYKLLAARRYTARARR